MSNARQACDRCHGKKLKCTRQPDSSCCMRCAKSNSDCKFSPVSRPNRMPFGGESISTSSATTMDQGGNQDGDQWFTVYPTLSNQINGFGSLALSAPEESQGLAALPQLMATLDEIWRGLPPADACHISLQDMGQYLEYIAGATFIGSILDQVLSCAQRLRQIYPSAVTDATTARHATHHAAGTGCTTEDCIHMQPLPPAGSSGTPIDYTALMFLAACHLRLLDIIGSVARHGKLWRWPTLYHHRNDRSFCCRSFRWEALCCRKTRQRTC